MRISIKSARVNRGMRQVDLAKAVNVNKKTIGLWESGKSKPRVDKIEKLCKALGVSYDDINWNS